MLVPKARWSVRRLTDLTPPWDLGAARARLRIAFSPRCAKAASGLVPYTFLDCTRGASRGSDSLHCWSGTAPWKSPKGMNLVAGGNAPGTGRRKDHDPARVEGSEPHAASIRPFQGRAVCWLLFRGRCPRLLNGALAGLTKPLESLLHSGEMRVGSRSGRRTPRRHAATKPRR